MSFEDCVTKFRCTISKQMEDEEKKTGMVRLGEYGSIPLKCLVD